LTQTIVAYVDESGDSGRKANGSSLTYTLGCVLVGASNWSDSFDNLVRLHRRIKSSFGVLVREEIKANFLIRNAGSFKDSKLAPGQRSLIYRSHLREMANDPNIRAFAVLVHKSENCEPVEVVETAWTALLQRLERTSREEGGRPILIIHDIGENEKIRKIARWARRRLSAGSTSGSGGYQVPFLTLVDDPIPKASHESYFLQLSDLVAYAAFRRIYPPSEGISRIVNEKMWENLGRATFSAANGLKRVTAPGIVEIWI
jgi:hypothetical protein